MQRESTRRIIANQLRRFSQDHFYVRAIGANIISATTKQFGALYLDIPRVAVLMLTDVKHRVSFLDTFFRLVHLGASEMDYRVDYEIM
jgi:hypothetical protein